MSGKWSNMFHFYHSLDINSNVQKPAPVIVLMHNLIFQNRNNKCIHLNVQKTESISI